MTRPGRPGSDAKVLRRQRGCSPGWRAPGHGRTQRGPGRNAPSEGPSLILPYPNLTDRSAYACPRYTVMPLTTLPPHALADRCNVLYVCLRPAPGTAAAGSGPLTTQGHRCVPGRPTLSPLRHPLNVRTIWTTAASPRYRSSGHALLSRVAGGRLDYLSPPAGSPPRSRSPSAYSHPYSTVRVATPLPLVLAPPSPSRLPQTSVAQVPRPPIYVASQS